MAWNTGGDATTGYLHTRNLTNHAAGLMIRSDAEIKTMLLDGTRPNVTSAPLKHPIPSATPSEQITPQAGAIIGCGP